MLGISLMMPEARNILGGVRIETHCHGGEALKAHREGRGMPENQLQCTFRFSDAMLCISGSGRHSAGASASLPRAPPGQSCVAKAALL